jgi:hypothetical protein
MWKNIVELGRRQMTKMAHAFCMLGTSGYEHTLCFYVTIIVFPLQQ